MSTVGVKVSSWFEEFDNLNIWDERGGEMHKVTARERDRRREKKEKDEVVGGRGKEMAMAPLPYNASQTL